jgi:hypothetical protein
MINVPNHFIPLENRTCVLLWLQLGVKKCTVLNHAVRVGGFTKFVEISFMGLDSRRFKTGFSGFL